MQYPIKTQEKTTGPLSRCGAATSKVQHLLASSNATKLDDSIGAANDVGEVE